MGIEPSDDGKIQGPVSERPTSANPGLIFFFSILYLPSYALLGVSFCVIITQADCVGPLWFQLYSGFNLYRTVS